MIRDYNIFHIKNESMVFTKEMLDSIHDHSGNLTSSLDQKLQFCSQVHTQHNFEADTYVQFIDLFD